MSHILIVDDNLDLCRPLALLLTKRLGCEVVCAHSGEEAIRRVSESPPDLVILDVMMPEMDGMEVLRRLRADSRNDQLPIVMFSAVDDKTSREYALQHGADDFWLKASFSFDEFKQRVEPYLKSGSKLDA